MKKIKNYIISEYIVTFVFLFLIILIMIHSTTNGLYFRLTGDPTPKLIWYPVSLLFKNLFPADFSFLWSPLFGAGVPFLADPFLGGILPYRIFLVLAPNFYIALILMTAGFFTYLFARTINIGKGGSLLAALCFMLNAYFIQYMTHSQLEVDAFLPVVLLCFYLIIKKKNMNFAVLAGFIFSLAILGMSPESTFYIMFLVIIYISGLVSNDFFTKKGELTGSLKYVFIAIALGILITSFQVLPLLEYLYGHVFHYRSLSRGLTHNPLENLFSIISSKYHFRHNWVYTPYVGAKILAILVLAGIWSSIRKFNIHKTLFLVNLFLLVGICYGYLNKFFNFLPIPVFKQMANEKHPIPAIAFCLAIIGGFGLDYILKRISNRKTRILVLILIITGAGYELLRYYRKEPLRFNFPEISLNETPSYVGFLKKDKDVYRIYIKPWDGLKETGRWDSPVLGNNIEIFNINNFCYDTTFYPYRSHKYISVLLKGESRGFTSSIDKVESYQSPLFNLLNIKYIAGQYLPDLEKSTKGQYHLVFDKEIKIYENKDVLPRTFMVYNAETLDTEKQIIERLVGPDFNPKETIIIEVESPEEISANNVIREKGSIVNIVNYKPREIDIKVETQKNGFLFFGDMYYPGWKVYVDGNIDKIYRANYLFRAVFLNKGIHDVKFVYKPLSFKLGACLTVSTLIFCLILILYSKGVLSKTILKVLTSFYLIFVIVNLIMFYQDFKRNIDPFTIKEKPLASGDSQIK